MIPREKNRTDSKILLKAHHHKWEEGVAKDGEAIMPGMLVENDTTTGVPHSARPVVQKHATAGGAARKTIALESLLAGKRTIEDEIADGDVVFMHECQPGDVVMVRVADDFDATAKTQLESAGDGTFQAVTTGVALFEVEDDIDFSEEDAVADGGPQRLARAKAL